jgi:hypothetical protein
MVTEPGNFYAILFSSLQNTRFGRTDDSFAVNAQSDGFQLNRSLSCVLHVACCVSYVGKILF